MARKQDPRFTRACKKCRPIHGAPGMFTCFTKDGARLVHGQLVNRLPGSVWSPTTAVQHLESVDVGDRLGVTASWLATQGVPSSYRARFEHAMTQAVTCREFVKCGKCERTVRRDGRAHHQRGIACQSDESLLKASRAGLTFANGERSEIPLALRTTYKVLGQVREKRKLVDRLVPTVAVPWWTSKVLGSLENYGAYMDLVCEAVRAHGAEIKDRYDYGSQWQRGLTACASKLTKAFLDAAVNDESEKEFGLSLLNIDEAQFQAYVTQRAPDVVQDHIESELSRRGLVTWLHIRRGHVKEGARLRFAGDSWIVEREDVDGLRVTLRAVNSRVERDMSIDDLLSTPAVPT